MSVALEVSKISCQEKDRNLYALLSLFPGFFKSDFSPTVLSEEAEEDEGEGEETRGEAWIGAGVVALVGVAGVREARRGGGGRERKSSLSFFKIGRRFLLVALLQERLTSASKASNPSFLITFMQKV